MTGVPSLIVERILAPLAITPHDRLVEMRCTTSIVLSTVTSVVGSSTATVCESAALCSSVESSARDRGLAMLSLPRASGSPSAAVLVCGSCWAAAGAATRASNDAAPKKPRLSPCIILTFAIRGSRAPSCRTVTVRGEAGQVGEVVTITRSQLPAFRARNESAGCVLVSNPSDHRSRCGSWRDIVVMHVAPGLDLGTMRQPKARDHAPRVRLPGPPADE